MRVEKWISAGCAHAMQHDEECLEWLLGVIRSEKPHGVVFGGDLFEASAASRFPNEDEWDLDDEIEVADRILRSIREAAPAGARMVFTEGNHDANILAKGRLPRPLRRGYDYRRRLTEFSGGHWERIPYIYCRHRGVFRVGQLAFFHGAEHGVSAEENQVHQVGIPYGLLTVGHTHRPREVFRVMKTKSVPTPFYAANHGCLRNIVECEYMDRKSRALWGQAALVAETVVYDDDRLPMRVEWSAQILPFRTYDEAVIAAGGFKAAPGAALTLPGAPSASARGLQREATDRAVLTALGAASTMFPDRAASRAAVAARVGMPPQTVSEALGRLQARGLAIRVRAGFWSPAEASTIPEDLGGWLDI